jgi:hypothetical protein
MAENKEELIRKALERHGLNPNSAPRFDKILAAYYKKANSEKDLEELAKIDHAKSFLMQNYSESIILSDVHGKEGEALRVVMSSVGIEDAKRALFQGDEKDARRILKNVGFSDGQIDGIFSEWGGGTLGSAKEAKSAPASGGRLLLSAPDQSIKEEARKMFFAGDNSRAAKALLQGGYRPNDVQDMLNAWHAERQNKGEGAYALGVDRKRLSAPKFLPAPGQIAPLKAPKIPFHLPRLGRHNDIVWTMVMIVAGMTAAALIGSMWIFFAFLFLAVHIVVPGPDEVIGRNLVRIKEKYMRRIEKATGPEREALEKDLEETLKNQRVIERLKAEQIGINWGVSSVKYLFKAGFFIFFSLGFITSAIPLLKPIGILLAFAGYFMEG